MEDLDFSVTQIGHLNYRKPNANWKIQDMINEKNYILASAEQGSAHYEIDGRRVRINSQDVLFFKKGEPHTGYSDAEHPWSFYTIGFNMEFNNDYTKEFFKQFDTLHRHVNTVQHRALFPNMYKVWLFHETGYLIKCKSTIMDILYELILAKTHYNLPPAHIKKINKALHFIMENPKKTHRVEELAQISGFSVSYFRLLFKQMTGHTVTNYQNMLRIRHAHDLLQTGDCNVGQAAAAAGFIDVGYFSRMHNKMFGYAPSQCKKARDPLGLMTSSSGDILR